jgi:hypothetical protein
MSWAQQERSSYWLLPSNGFDLSGRLEAGPAPAAGSLSFARHSCEIRLVVTAVTATFADHPAPRSFPPNETAERDCLKRPFQG